MSDAGIDVEGTRAAWAGRLSYNGRTVAYRLETRAGRATAVDMTSRYSFPARISARGLQDWTIGTGSGVLAQSYLDGSVYLAERVPIDDPADRDSLVRSVQDGFSPFGQFERAFVGPMHGQQVFDQPTIFPPKPADSMVVDYLSAQDVAYLAKLWGWTYSGTYEAPSSAAWTVPVNIRKRTWIISGLPPARTGVPILSDINVSFRFQAAGKRLQDRVRNWPKRFKTDRVELFPDSAEGQVSTTIELKGGRSLASIRKSILEFVRRAEKLPTTEDSVYG